ncbi:MAG: DUF4339 domain-containing protein [Lentisphaeraceae bacterium]|nr:DUF4339 domain-containing protein [Lentisphaeraceae bacterium]
MWYIKKNKRAKESGPFTYEEVISLIELNKVGQKSFAITESMADYRPILETVFEDQFTKNFPFNRDNCTEAIELKLACSKCGCYLTWKNSEKESNICEKCKENRRR